MNVPKKWTHKNILCVGSKGEKIAHCSLLVNDPPASENEKGTQSLLKEAAHVQIEKPDLS